GETRGDGLSEVHVPLDDDTVDGRIDRGEREVLLRAIEGDTCRSHRGIRYLLCRAALFERAPRDEPGGRKLDVATLIVLRLVGLRLHLLEIRLGIGHALPGDGRIDPGEELALLDMIVEVDEELGDLSRHLGADAHGRYGLK